MENLTVETFKEKVFDYTNNSEWSYKGDKPAIIDFYADWCQPCKTVAPILEELDAEYDGLEVYKINTEEQQELAATFGIQSIPSLLFVPAEGQPQMAMGALPKDVFKKAIKEVLGLDDPAVQDAEQVKDSENTEDKPE
jgi:thioredoxin